MILGGLWHGASLNFVVWGAMHGVALAFDKMRWSWMKHLQGGKVGGKFLKLAGVIITFHFVCFCWIFFKAATFHDAWALIHQIVYDFQPEILVELYQGYTAVFWVMLLGFVLHFMPAKAEFSMEKIYARLPLAGSVAVMVIFVWLLIQVKSSQPMIPIYFQF